MKLTKEMLKGLIKEEMAKVNEFVSTGDENAAPAQDAGGNPNEPKISYTGMKKFAQALLAGEAIPAGVVTKARQEMQADPSAGVMAEFVTALCRSFGIDEQELTRILSGVRKGL